jgi:hypothetical protein
MPWKVQKGKGSRPYKIKNTRTGRIVGSSKTKAAAKKSVRARYANSKH